jgi:hypothetical protein
MSADIDFAASAPNLRPIAVGVLAGRIVALFTGAVLVALVTRSRRRY